jgi:hypothetical protein
MMSSKKIVKVVEEARITMRKGKKTASVKLMHVDAYEKMGYERGVKPEPVAEGGK